MKLTELEKTVARNFKLSAWEYIALVYYGAVDIGCNNRHLRNAATKLIAKDLMCIDESGMADRTEKGDALEKTCWADLKELRRKVEEQRIINRLKRTEICVNDLLLLFPYLLSLSREDLLSVDIHWLERLRENIEKVKSSIEVKKAGK